MLKTYDEILDAPFYYEDADVDSLREYFHALLHQLWVEGEGFSGKRPFGNSGWDFDIYRGLIMVGATEGEVIYDEDGYLVDIKVKDYRITNGLVVELIKHCFEKGE